MPLYVINLLICYIIFDFTPIWINLVHLLLQFAPPIFLFVLIYIILFLGDCGEGRKKWYSQHWQKEVRIMFAIINICSINHVYLKLELLCFQTNGLIMCLDCMVVQNIFSVHPCPQNDLPCPKWLYKCICWCLHSLLIYHSYLIERHILCISCKCTYKYCIYM